MASATSSKALLAATAGLLSSSTSSLVHRRPLACSASTHHPRLASYPPDLVRWVRREGGFVHPQLRIADGGTDGFGLVAAGDIPKGTRLVALPEHLPLRLRWPDGAIGGADRPGSPLFELVNRVPEELWAMRLGLKLLHERAKSGSFWWPYISNLPEAFNIPIFFSGEDVKSIQYIPIIHQVNKRCRFLLDFEKMAKCILEDVVPEDHPFCDQDVTSSSLGWAMSAVSSRAFRLHGKTLQDGTSDVPMLLPLIDMCNHSFHPNALIVQEENNPDTLVEVNKRCRFLLDFEKMAKCILEDVVPEDHPFCDQDVTSSSLGWAMSAVSSRAFRLHGKTLQDGTSDVPMLLPLIDMCNHSFHPNALIVQEENNPDTLVEVVSEMSIEKDAPVTLNYGCLSNDLFLLDYGFVMSPNPYDHVELKYDAILLDAASVAAGAASPSFSSPNDWQKEILSQLNLLGDGALLKVDLGGLELVDGRLLAALRVVLAENVETARHCDVNTLKSLPGEAPLGFFNETAALRTVIALCVIALQHFPTKLMDDESILKGNISDSMKLAVQFRMHKKSMIIDLMRELTRRVKMLSQETLTANRS